MAHWGLLRQIKIINCIRILNYHTNIRLRRLMSNGRTNIIPGRNYFYFRVEIFVPIFITNVQKITVYSLDVPSPLCLYTSIQKDIGIK
jgi:hypothetical protein